MRHFVSFSRRFALRLRAVLMAWLKRRIEAADNPADRLNTYANMRFIPRRLSLWVLDLFLQTLLSERDPLFTRILEQCDDIEPDVLRILLQTYGAEYRGVPLSLQTFQTNLATLKVAPWPFTRVNVLYLLLAALKNESLESVRDVLNTAPAFPLHKLPPAYKIGALRLAAREGKASYTEWYHLAAPNPLEVLQIQDIASAAGFGDALRHRDMGQALCAALPAPMRAELETRVLPFYAAQQEHQMRWMDCRHDAAQKASFIADIADHLTREVPYNLIRLGDGEAYAFADKLSLPHAIKREQAWWGVTLDPSLRAQIAQDMHRAIAKANRLGIPSLFRFARDSHPSLGSYADHVSLAGLIHVLDGVQELHGSTRLYTEERIHQLCFDLETIGQLSHHARKVVIVSSLRQQTIADKLRPQLAKVPFEVIEVPTHTKTRGNAMFEQSDQPLPFVYREIEAHVAQMATPGALVLIACGSLGKVFCAAASESGGVALDVGAMVDYWIGLKTRSIADMA